LKALSLRENESLRRRQSNAVNEAASERASETEEGTRPEGEAMSKFILIDHSITDLGGHHCEYAMRVLAAAEKAGYTPVLATNRELRLERTVSWDLYPVYQYGFWFQLHKPRWMQIGRPVAARLSRLLFRAKCRFLFSPVGALWLARRNAVEFTRAFAALSPTTRILLVLATLVSAPLLALLAMARILVTNRLVSGILRGVGQLLRAVVSPIGAVAGHRRAILAWLARAIQSRGFSRDTKRLFQCVELAQGDVVFIPTLAETEMIALLRYFRREPRSSLATWHLLFRRNIYAGREPDYPTQDEFLRPMRNAFRRFRDQCEDRRVYFYTDTDRLTDQYNRLGVVPFTSLPIPVSGDYRCDPPADPATNVAAHREGQPLEVIYIGDARSEKGYQYLPRVVQDLWADFARPGRLRFTFQSNFNVPGGEPHAVVARNQLRTYPPESVTLLCSPLESDAYRDLVLRGDVALILYDRDNYYARSSGIFVEAMTAGVPVVVPAGSWMAAELAEAVGDYHDRLRDGSVACVTAANVHRRWYIDGQGKPLPPSAGNAHHLHVAGRVRRWERLAIPRDSSHLLVRFRYEGQETGDFLRVSVAEEDGRKQPLLRTDHIVGIDRKSRGSAIVRLQPETRSVILGFQGAFGERPIELSHIETVCLMATDPLPLGVVGTSYSDPMLASQCVREILEHYEHYRESAVQFAEAWSGYHNPASLVAAIALRAEDPSHPSAQPLIEPSVRDRRVAA